MDEAVQQAFEAAGYRLEGDAEVMELAGGIEVRANDLSHLLEMCAGQNVDPLTVVAAIIENVRCQPAIQAAMQAPAARRTVNVSLKSVRLRPASS